MSLGWGEWYGPHLLQARLWLTKPVRGRHALPQRLQGRRRRFSVFFFAVENDAIFRAVLKSNGKVWGLQWLRRWVYFISTVYILHDFFSYTHYDNVFVFGTGAVYSQYPSKKKSRRPIKHPFIPDKEENVTTREVTTSFWFHKSILWSLKVFVNSDICTVSILKNSILLAACGCK